MASSLSNFNNGFLCSIFPCKQYGNSLAGENVYDWTNRKTLSQPGCAVSGDGTFIQSADALTQSSVYSTHKNLAVRKIMQAYAKKKLYTKSWKRTQKKKRDSVSKRPKQNMTQTITEHTRVCEKKARIVCEHFISLNLKGAFEMRRSFLYFFFAGTHFRIFVRKFLVHFSQKLARPLYSTTKWTALFPIKEHEFECSQIASLSEGIRKNPPMTQEGCWNWTQW